MHAYYLDENSSRTPSVSSRRTGRHALSTAEPVVGITRVLTGTDSHASHYDSVIAYICGETGLHHAVQKMSTGLVQIANQAERKGVPA